MNELPAYMDGESVPALRTVHVESFAADLVHGARLAWKRKGFSAAVVLTLALGIGGSSAAFSLIDGVVLRPLPYPESGRLHVLYEENDLGARRLPSYPTFVDWATDAESFEGMAFLRGAPLNYETDEGAGLLVNAFVSEEFFSVMGTRAALGRALNRDDYRPTSAAAAVLSDRAWRQWFGGEADAMGRTIRMAGRVFTIVGIMPPRFVFPDWGVATDVWLPMTSMPPAERAALEQRDFHADSRLVARVRQGVSPERARLEMEGVASRVAEAYPDSDGPWNRVAIVSLQEFVVGNLRPRLFMLGGVVLTVLLIGCLNLGNLYVIQGMARRREYAIRAVLGADHLRVRQQLVTESLVLTGLGGVLGVLAAVGVLDWVRQGGLPALSRTGEVALDLRVLAFAALLTIGTALLFAATGARNAGSARIMEKGALRSGASVASWRWLPAWVQSAQVGLTFVLLVGAALLTQSLWHLTRVEPGFDPVRLVTIRINPPSPAYDGAGAAIDLYTRLLESVGSVTGVEGVGLTNHGPGSNAGAATPAAVDGPPGQSARAFPVMYRTVSAGYFSLLGIPLLEGRDFDENDLASGPGPIIINETLAQQWGEESPLGQTLGVLKAARTRSDFGEPLVGRVVGVTADMYRPGSDEDPPAVVFVPFSHNPWSEVSVLARTTGPPAPLLGAIEGAVKAVDVAIPVSGQFVGASTVEALRARATYNQRLNATLVGAFALIALLLATVGMYGVTAFAVSLETRAIGVRMALGATNLAVMRAVLRRVLVITATGLALGALVAVALGRLLTGLLFQVQSSDPVTFLAIGVVTTIVAIVAGYLPARRAGRIDPLVALWTD